jgi:hypothetical protein
VSTLPLESETPNCPQYTIGKITYKQEIQINHSSPENCIGSRKRKTEKTGKTDLMNQKGALQIPKAYLLLKKIYVKYWLPSPEMVGENINKLITSDFSKVVENSLRPQASGC